MEQRSEQDAGKGSAELALLAFILLAVFAYILL